MKPIKSLVNDPKKYLELKLLKLNIICDPKRFSSILILLSESNSGKFKSQNILKNLEFLVRSTHLPVDLVAWYSKHLSYGCAVTLEKLIHFYGSVDGTVRWDSYCKKQAISNTMEYKAEHHGMDLKGFETYNKSRAVTMTNQLIKHGDIIGRLRFESYCEKQKTAGISLEYFEEKYGKIQGRQEYNRVCSKKAHTMENFIRKYGDEIGPKKFIETLTKSNKFYSLGSQRLFRLLEETFPELSRKSHFATKTGEYMIYSKTEGRCYFYDYVNTEYGFCIEYNGDHYHANPKLYNPNDTPTRKKGILETAQTIWDNDARKNQALKTERNIKTLVVWESDFISDPKNIIEKIKHELNLYI